MKSLKELLKENNHNALLAYIHEHEAYDFADEVDDLDDNELSELLQSLPDIEVAHLLEESDDEERLRIALMLDEHRFLMIINDMSDDDIVDILSDFNIGKRKKLLDQMKKEDRDIITGLLQYPDESAGGLMTTAYIALREERTVAEGLKRIVEIAPKTEQLQTIYVVDDKNNLCGSVDLRKLLTSPRTAKLLEIMSPHPISIEAEADQEEAAKLVARYDLNTLPVVTHGQLLGVITVDDIIDVIIQESDEDLLKLYGVNEEETLESTLFESVKMRLPWLLVNLLTAFLASSVVKLFEDTISQVVALSAIMTIISGMGGNAGSQTMSIVVRHLARETVNSTEGRRALFKEIFAGIINGAINGIVTSIVVYIIYHNVFLSLIVIVAMIGNMVVAGIFGFLVPVCLKMMHQDPAVASSIFVTTATDVLGFFIFLALAKLFLPLLI